MFTYRDLLKAKEYNGQPVRYMQEKADGIRLMVSKQGGVIQCLTRNGLTDFAQQIGRTHWGKLIEELPDNTVLDCECHKPGVQATHVKTMLLASDPAIVLTPFAVPLFEGCDRRGGGLVLMTNLIRELGFEPANTQLVEGIDPDPTGITQLERVLDDMDQDLIKSSAVNRKIEGFVLKRRHYEGWYKIKPKRTCECMVVGFTLSTSDSFAGGLKAIQVGLYDQQTKKLVEVASVGSGFEAEYRMTVNPTTLTGRVAEIEYDSVASRGKLKFPRFKCWRDDKAAQDCVMSQVTPDVEI